jgi:hypothetical protein
MKHETCTGTSTTPHNDAYRQIFTVAVFKWFPKAPFLFLVWFTYVLCGSMGARLTDQDHVCFFASPPAPSTLPVKTPSSPVQPGPSQPRRQSPFCITDTTSHHMQSLVS